MARLDQAREQFIYIYVKFYRHHITKKLVFPKPPNKYLRLKIRKDKYKAYQERKRGTKKTAA